MAAEVVYETEKTEPKSVVISDNRYRGPDASYPDPVGSQPSATVKDLCSTAFARFKDTNAPSRLKIETDLLKAAGSSLSDPIETQRSKIARWWAANDLRCDMLSSANRNLLQMFIRPDLDGLDVVDEIVLHYRLPLNDVDRDGRTVLDYVADKADGESAGRLANYKTIYGTFRRFGAKHRKELEAEGRIASKSNLGARRVADLTRLFEAGDASAGLDIVLALAPSDLAAATRWLDRTEALALQNGSGRVLGYIGEAYLDPPRRGPALSQSKPPFAGRRDRAVRVLEAASKARFTTDESISEGLAKFYLGYAYYMGLGTPKNLDRALAVFRPLSGDANAQMFAAEILLARGQRKEAIEHLRNVAFSSQGGSPFMGTTVSEWLKSQPEGVCGRSSTGHVYTGC